MRSHSLLIRWLFAVVCAGPATALAATQTSVPTISQGEMEAASGVNIGQRNRLKRLERKYVESGTGGEQLASAYVENGLLQESIWLYRKLGQYSAAEELRVRLSTLFETAEPERAWRLEVPVDEIEIYLLRFPGNVYAVYKKEDGPTTAGREKSGYDISEFYGLDLIPFTIKRGLFGHAHGSLVYFMRHSVPMYGDYNYKRSAKLKMLDVLTANFDRRPENPNFVMWLAGTEEVAFDSGAAFDSKTKTARDYLRQFHALAGGKKWERKNWVAENLKAFSQDPSLRLLEKPDGPLVTKLHQNLPSAEVEAVQLRKASLLELDKPCEKALQRAKSPRTP